MCACARVNCLFCFVLYTSVVMWGGGGLPCFALEFVLAAVVRFRVYVFAVVRFRWYVLAVVRFRGYVLRVDGRGNHRG